MGRTPDVLTAREAADLLGAHVETIRRLARRGEIPSYKIGKDWRFRRESLLRWAEAHQRRRRVARILVVDDDPAVREVCRRTLEDEGYAVAAASSGEEALEHVGRETPDLVLLDLRLSGITGVGFLRRFREDHPDIPVIIVTGYPDSDLMSQAMRHGSVALLAKPMEQEELVRAVRVALRGSLGRNSAP